MNYPYTNVIKGRAIFACIIALIANMYVAILQFEPTYLAQQLLAHAQLSHEQLGLIVSIFFYAYIASLIIAGIIIDLIGPRWTLTVALCIMLISNVLFLQTDSLSILIAMRIFMGLCAAFAVISVLQGLRKGYGVHNFSCKYNT